MGIICSRVRLNIERRLLRARRGIRTFDGSPQWPFYSIELALIKASERRHDAQSNIAMIIAPMLFCTLTGCTAALYVSTMELIENVPRGARDVKCQNTIHGA